MRIEVFSPAQTLDNVGIGLTQEEAEELRDKLEILIADAASRHEHVSSADYQTELTVWIERGDVGPPE